MSQYSIFQISLLAILTLLLGISVTANFAVFKKAKEFYTREQHIRLTAVDRQHANGNAKLAPKKDGTQRIILYGDSKCSQWDPLPQWANTEIIDRGIGGETTAQILERINDDVLELKPDTVIFQAGVNDLKAIGVLPQLQEKITQDCVDNIKTICDQLTNQGIRVILTTILTPAPIEFQRIPLWSDKVNQSVDAANDQLRAIENPLVTLFDCDTYFRDGKYIKAEYSFDTLHLNKTGYQHWNASLEKYVFPQ
ncbi:GDSL-type esterase/lipase family protein [Puniceicoccaceae bacterium K14]|nr:GDSL-type esterase/lipase family protein [Puniceicoccaceae bacterium K14]